MKVWRHIYTVRGGLAFPLDMLRYDGSHPVHEHEAHEIENSIISAGSDAPLTITLRHYTRTKEWHPNAERWKSFGWEVTTVEHEAVEW